MTNRAAKACLFALIFEGSASAFLSRSTKSRFAHPLKNSYLETLTVSDKDDIGTSSTTFSNGPGNPVFPTQIPKDNGGDETKSSPEVSSTVSNESSKGLGQQTTVVAEVMPQQGSSAPPDPIPGANGWTRVEPTESGDANVAKKASYESERKKYDQSVRHNPGPGSFQETRLKDDDEAEDATIHQATVVEVLPKDPLFEDADSHDFLTSKNSKLPNSIPHSTSQ